MRHNRLMTALLTAGLLSLSGPVLAQDSPGEPQQDQPQDTAEATDSPATRPTARAAWQKTFPPKDAASYLPSGDEVSVIVVAAGGHAEAAVAADALEGALRASGNFKLVMNDDVLADNSKVDDETIIAKTDHLPVGHVAVVRVFESGEGKAPSGVVTLYDKDSGEALTAMAVTRGTPIEANTRPTTNSGAGVSKEAADAVAATTEISQKNVETAKKEYLANYVWFEELAAVNSSGVLTTWTNAYRGKYKEPLNGGDFYEEVGRPDLATDYRTNIALKISGQLIGIAAAAGGMIYGITADDAYPYVSQKEQMEQRETTGWIIAGTGGVVYLLASLFDPHPVEPNEARRLADKHNNMLKNELGLSEASVENLSTEMKWSIDATGMKDGGSVRLRVDF